MDKFECIAWSDFAIGATDEESVVATPFAGENLSVSLAASAGSVMLELVAKSAPAQNGAGLVELASPITIDGNEFSRGAHVALIQSFRVPGAGHLFASILEISDGHLACRMLVSSFTLKAGDQFQAALREIPPSVSAGIARGTLIQTPHADIAIESLEIGDEIDCADGQSREIRAVHRRRYSAIELLFYPGLRPVLVKAGTLPGGRPCLDLTISNATRLMTGQAADSSDPDACSHIETASNLIGKQGALLDLPCCGVEYFSVTLDKPAMMAANGVWTVCNATDELPETLAPVSETFAAPAA